MKEKSDKSHSSSDMLFHKFGGFRDHSDPSSLWKFNSTKNSMLRGVQQADEHQAKNESHHDQHLEESPGVLLLVQRLDDALDQEKQG